MAIRLLGAGGAAPRWRLRAASVAEAWDRKGGRGQVAVCPPDEDPLTLGWDAGTAALAAAGIDRRPRRRALLGNQPATVRGGAEPRRLRGRVGMFGSRRRRAPLGVDTRGHRRAAGRRRRGGGRFRAHRAGDRVRRPPARTGHRVRSALVVPARPPSCSPPAAEPRRSGRASPAAAPSSTATAATARTTCATSTTRGLFREEIFLPVVAEVAPRPRLVRRTSAGRSPIPTVASARRSPSCVGARRARRRRRCTPRSATPARRLRCSAPSARSTAPGLVGVVGSGGGRTTGVLVDVETPVPGAARVVAALGGGERRELHRARCAPAGNSHRRARPSRWACRPRARCSCGAPTRCSACSAAAASTAARSARRRRSTRRASRAAGRSSNRSRSRAKGRCTPTS